MARTKDSAAEKPMAAKGQPTVSAVKYRPRDGHGFYDATVARENDNGTLDIIVHVPGWSQDLALNRIRLDAGNPAPGHCCQKKGHP